MSASDYFRADCSISDLENKLHGDVVSTTGILSRIEDQHSVAGEWVTAILTDSTGAVALNVYSDVYPMYRSLLISGALVRVTGFKQNGYADDYDSFAVNVQEVTS